MTPPFEASQTPLSPVEVRVLGTLLEKARTVPDSYPLSLNALVVGCNQKSSRDPVMTLSEAQLLPAIERLQVLGLLHQSSSARSARFEHLAHTGLGVPTQSTVLLGLLMLRGPQTAAELRLNAERWYDFADTSSVEAFLDELQERDVHKGGPLVNKLPKAPGAREHRWAHLLSGPVTADPGSNTIQAEPSVARLQALEDQVQSLQLTVQRLCQALGIDPQAPA